MRTTKGPLRPTDIPGTDEAYFFYPTGTHPDWHEPMVFAVTAMQRELEPYINGHRPGLPEGVTLEKTKMDPGLAERLVVSGAVERPLVDAAHAAHYADPNSPRLHFFAIHGHDEDGMPRGTLIDGSHSYRSCYERGEQAVVGVFMLPVFYERFLIGGVPDWVCATALGQGEGDTSRYEYEVKTGRRPAMAAHPV